MVLKMKLLSQCARLWWPWQRNWRLAQGVYPTLDCEHPAGHPLLLARSPSVTERAVSLSRTSLEKSTQKIVKALKVITLSLRDLHANDVPSVLAIIFY